MFREEKHEVTGAELAKWLGKTAAIKSYSDVVRYGNIDEALGPTQASAVIFPTSASMDNGHWIAIWIDHQNQTIQHFDSYGFSPQYEREFSSNQEVDDGDLNKMYQNAQAQDGYRLVWNTIQFQSRANDVNTCGRHTAVRLLNRQLSNEQYADMLRKEFPGMTFDEAVVKITGG